MTKQEGLGNQETHAEMDSDSSTVFVPGPESPIQRRELDHVYSPDDGNRSSLFKDPNNNSPRLKPRSALVDDILSGIQLAPAGDLDVTPEEFRDDH